MTPKVFISYRREDSAGHAGRIHDRLARELGSNLLFMDVDDIPLGTNFVKALREEVAKCRVLLAVIGPDWLDVCDENGRRRLDNPNDFVRVEVAAALQREIPVIPILLEGTRVPSANQLPEDLQELSLRNGVFVRHSSFHDDMERLIRGLRQQSGRTDANPIIAARPSLAEETKPPENLKAPEAEETKAWGIMASIQRDDEPKTPHHTIIPFRPVGPDEGQSEDLRAPEAEETKPLADLETPQAEGTVPPGDLRTSRTEETKPPMDVRPPLAGAEETKPRESRGTPPLIRQSSFIAVVVLFVLASTFLSMLANLVYPTP